MKKSTVVNKKASSILKKSTNPKLRNTSGLMRSLSPYPQNQNNAGAYIGDNMDGALNI